MAAFESVSKSTELSKAEYLKRYLSEENDAKKSKGKLKKKKRKVTGKGLKIVDDDVDWKQMVKEEEEVEEDEEEAPVIAEVIDDRPEEVKQMEVFRTGNRWKVIGGNWFFLCFVFNVISVNMLYIYFEYPLPIADEKEDTDENNGNEHENEKAETSSKKSKKKSPVRKTRHDSPDISPPRRARHDSPDISPPRRARHDSPDLSPPRHHSGKSGKRLRLGDPKMLSGRKAGLVSGDLLRKEQEENRRKEKHNQPLEDDSRNAKTVFRDKSGKRRDLESEREEKRKKAEEKAIKDEKYAQWGIGMAQSEMRQQNLEDAVHEAQKPLARHLDDEDLDRMLREQERDGDPMAAMLRRKKERSTTTKEKPRYKGPAPPLNRFNILPGYRWDGVNRSNGFEKKRYERMADKRAAQEAAYKWSVEDM
uniref:BUD13 homolog n=1 Tax=Takifugu rubripes TaxID=31033 RepID=H2V3P3_TAKRU